MVKDYGDLAPFIPTIEFFDETLQMAVDYILDMKKRFRDDPKKFESFSTTVKKIVNEKVKCNGDVITLKETPESAFTTIKGVLQGDQDLIVRFDAYLPLTYNTNHGYIKSLNEVSDHSYTRKPSAAREIELKKRKEISEGHGTDSDKAKKKICGEVFNFLDNKVREKLSAKNYIDLLGSLYCYGRGELEKSKLESHVENIVGEIPDLVQGLKNYLKQCESLGTQAKTQLQKERKTCEKSASNDHDKSKLPKPIDSSKHGLSIRLKQDKKNKILDDRDNLNVLIEWFVSASKYAQALLDCKQDQEDFSIKKKLFKRCLERIYGEEGSSMKKLCKEKPQTTVPKVLSRFEQKLKEYREFESEVVEIQNEALGNLSS